MVIQKRRQNEQKFGAWVDLPGGGRRYWHDVPGRHGWMARYVKEVNEMVVTRQDVADRLIAYLHHRLTLDELVDWAERAMLDAVFSPRDHDVVRAAVGRLGLADVRAFDLTWQECESLLDELGYKVHLEITPT
jgi:hypothetical protein